MPNNLLHKSDIPAAKYVLAVDVGTTSIKHACIDATGQVAHYHTIPLPYHARIEQTDITQWVEQLVQDIRAIPKSLRQEIAAIITSGQGPSLVPIINTGQPRGPLFFRATLDSTYDILHSRQQSHYIPFVLQYLYAYPNLRTQLRSWIPIPEYFVYSLSNKLTTMLPSKKYRRYYWSRSALRYARLSRIHFPPYSYMGDVIAPISRDMAMRCDLPQGTPLLSGGLDFFMAIIGAHCYQKYAICDRAGTTQGLNFVGWPKQNNALFQRYPLLGGSIANQSLLILNSGAFLDAAHEQDFRAVRRFVRNEPLKTPPLLPSIKRKGVVEISHSRIGNSADGRDRIRVLESILFTMRYAAECHSISRHPKRHVMLTGGQARIAEWNQLKADMLSTECRCLQLYDVELLGSAAVAFCALGTYERLSEAVARISHQKERVVPRISDTSLARYRAFKTAFARQMT